MKTIKIQTVFGVVLLILFCAQALIWIVDYRPFSWSMFLVWFIVGFLGIVLIGPAKPDNTNGGGER